jgi:L-alanine-DL-glutamate epimerase-like enolase superfamily enzyme
VSAVDELAGSALAEPGEARVARAEVLAYRFPTDGPGGVEADGTLTWSHTTLVVVLLEAAGVTGLGYTYGPRACAALIEDTLADEVIGSNPLATGRCADAMAAAIRNDGRPGIGAMAVSALDVALWDLKARMLGVAVVDLLGRARDRVPVYGSGGFCNYPPRRLADQMRGWVERGIPRVKLKVSRRPGDDPGRLDAVRAAIGDGPELYVDSNGALTSKQALAWAHRFRDGWGVSWLEEPVSSDDVEGLRLVREHGPDGLDVAAGEYVYLVRDAAALLAAGAVDCLQLDVTRCGGITGILRAAAAAGARCVDVSGHCAPQLSAHALCAVPNLRHLEYFHDHERIERMAFDGVLEPDGGALEPDRSSPGLGLELRRADLEGCCVHRAEVHG